MRARPTRLLLVATVAVAVVLIGPAAAQASPVGAITHTPVAFLGIDVSDIVGDIIKKLVDWIVPDFASGWAISLVKWLVAVPNVADARAYPHLNNFRAGLVGVGFGLLSVTFTLACLHTATGTPEGGPALRRTITAAAVLVFYPRIVGLVVLGTNVLTGSMITNHLVVDGTDKMLGAALTGAIATNGIGASLLVAAGTVSAYFVAALMVLKIGLLALEAVFFLAGALVWGLYPLRSTSWLARAWSSAGLTLAVLPVAWALIFSAAALLTSDSLVWSSHGALSDQLQQIAKPFAAVSCLWVAKAAPGFLLTAARSMGMNPMSVAGLRLRRGRGGGDAQSRSPSSTRPSAVQTNADRFRGLGLALGQRAAPVVAGLRTRTSGIREAAAASVGRLDHALPAPAASAAGRVGGVAAKVAATPVKANRAYKDLAKRGAAARLLASSQVRPDGRPATATATTRGDERAAVRTPDPSTTRVTPAAGARTPELPRTSAAPDRRGDGSVSPPASGPPRSADGPKPASDARGEGARPVAPSGMEASRPTPQRSIAPSTTPSPRRTATANTPAAPPGAATPSLATLRPGASPPGPAPAAEGRRTTPPTSRKPDAAKATPPAPPVAPAPALPTTRKPS